jgi:hypothetical protein
MLSLSFFTTGFMTVRLTYIIKSSSTFKNAHSFGDEKYYVFTGTQKQFCLFDFHQVPYNANDDVLLHIPDFCG